MLFLGRLNPEKGADLLALIQARLQATSGAARLIVAGAGPGIGRSTALALAADGADVVVAARREALSFLVHSSLVYTTCGFFFIFSVGGMRIGFFFDLST